MWILGSIMINILLDCFFPNSFHLVDVVNETDFLPYFFPKTAILHKQISDFFVVVISIIRFFFFVQIKWKGGRIPKYIQGISLSGVEVL